MNPYIIPGLKNKAHKLKRIVQADDITSNVLDYFRLDGDIIRTKNRSRKIVTARHIICYLLRKHTGMTLQQIAEYLKPAISDHTTVLHGINYVTGQLSAKNENDIKNIMNEIYI
jgi:chromosomal replication initiator protein